VVMFSGNQLSQIAFGCAVAFAVALLHAKSHPYRTETDNFLAYVANVVVALTFFIGLLLYSDRDTGKHSAGVSFAPGRSASTRVEDCHPRYDDSKLSFGASLILLNLTVVGLGSAYIFHDRFNVTVRTAAKHALHKLSLLVFSEAREAHSERQTDRTQQKQRRASDIEMVAHRTSAAEDAVSAYANFTTPSDPDFHGRNPIHVDRAFV